MKFLLFLTILCILIGVCCATDSDCHINGAWRAEKEYKESYRMSILLSMFTKGTFASIVEFGPVAGQMKESEVKFNRA